MGGGRGGNLQEKKNRREGEKKRVRERSPYKKRKVHFFGFLKHITDSTEQ